MGEQRYISTLSLTSALDGSGCLNPRPNCLTLGKETRYPLYRRLCRCQGQCGRVRKISSPPRFDPRTVQPVASRYTEYAIPDVRLLRTKCVWELVLDLEYHSFQEYKQSVRFRDGVKGLRNRTAGIKAYCRTSPRHLIMTCVLIHFSDSAADSIELMLCVCSLFV